VEQGACTADRGGGWGKGRGRRHGGKLRLDPYCSVLSIGFVLRVPVRKKEREGETRKKGRKENYEKKSIFHGEK
jgi:hypothetical protein